MASLIRRSSEIWSQLLMKAHSTPFTEQGSHKNPCEIPLDCSSYELWSILCGKPNGPESYMRTLVGPMVLRLCRTLCPLLILLSRLPSIAVTVAHMSCGQNSSSCLAALHKDLLYSFYDPFIRSFDHGAYGSFIRIKGPLSTPNRRALIAGAPKKWNPAL